MEYYKLNNLGDKKPCPIAMVVEISSNMAINIYFTIYGIKLALYFLEVYKRREDIKWKAKP